MRVMRAIPKRGDPAEILRALGRDSIEQLEAFLEEEDIELDVLIYRDKEGPKMWEAKG